MVGARLSHFEINAKLGAGGMGEVYRATDTRLGREVAIKVLPEAFVSDRERLVRFEREARLLASLSHANVAGIYEVGEQEGTHFLVMELAEGETLAERIARAPLPLDEAVAIAIQIASGLEAAHEQGIVHRDLKPANVMVDPNGNVKILDFGLAKAFAAEARAASGEDTSLDLTASPTLTRATAAGMLVGTVAYMSPEQARGRPVDARADLWAFGCLLFEMLAGGTPFDGDTLTDRLAAIVRSEPDWSALPASTPPRLVRLIQRCLRKNPRERMRSVGDAGLILDEVASGDVELERAPSADAVRPWKLAAGLLAIAAGVFLGLWLLDGRGSTDDPGATVTAMSLLTDLPGWQGFPSLSPDGNQLLFVAEDGGDKDIFLLRVGGENAINLTADHPGKDNHPAWSPDGQRIAFDSTRDGGGIFVMGATGESPLRISDSGFHPAWSPDGTKVMYCDEDVVDVFTRTVTSRLTIVDIASGRQTVVAAEGDAVQGHWSPDGRLIAYWTAENGQRDIRTIRADGGAAFVSVTDDAAADWAPVWAPDGRWLYLISDRGGSPDLWRVPMDPATGEATGSPHSVTTGVASVALASLSADGRRIAIGIDSRASSIERLRFDPEREVALGEPERIFFSNNEVMQTSLSRDGAWIAYRSVAPQDDLFILRTDGSSRRRLTDDPARDRGPSWGPNGEWIAFYSNRLGSYSNYLIRSDGTGLRRIASSREFGANQAVWSHGGARIATAVTSEPRTTVFYDVDPAWLDAAATPQPIELGDGVSGFNPREWSPDDRRLSGELPGGSLAVLDVETEEVRELLRSDGSRFVTLPDLGWLDTRRLLLWDLDRSTAFVVDVESGEARAVPGIPGPSGFEVTDGGREIYLVRSIREADVWLLTLGE